MKLQEQVDKLRKFVEIAGAPTPVEKLALDLATDNEKLREAAQYAIDELGHIVGLHPLITILEIGSENND